MDTSGIKIRTAFDSMAISGRQPKISVLQGGELLARAQPFCYSYYMRNLTGQSAIPFSLADNSGQRHSLEEYRGSWLLMVFHRHLG
jgi:hypothetical protein